LISYQQTPIRQGVVEQDDNYTLQLSEAFLGQSAAKNDQIDVAREFIHFQEKMQKIMKLSEI